MAGDWIQMRHDLPDDPAVIGIAARVGLEEDHVVGKLHRLWSWADRQTTNGNAPSVTVAWIDRFLGVAGFAAAMVEVSWLKVLEDGIEIPRFDTYISQSAKQRALTARRARDFRNAKRNAPSVTKSAPKEERKKRRELPTVVPPVVPSGELAQSARSSPVKPRISIEEIQTAWNATPGVRKCLAVNAARKRAFSARAKEPEFLDGWRDALARFPLKCFASEPEGWQPDLDWFLRPQTVTAILEGKYDFIKRNGSGGSSGAGEGRRPGSPVASRGRVRERDYSHLDGPTANRLQSEPEDQDGGASLFP